MKLYCMLCQLRDPALPLLMFRSEKRWLAHMRSNSHTDDERKRLLDEFGVKL